MDQKINSKTTSIYLFENLLFVLGIVLPIIIILPKTKVLLNSSPSSIGWAELVIFFSHVIMGLSCYFIFLLLNRFYNIKIILILSLIYLVFIDLDIFMYKKNWLIIGVLITRIIQLSILLLLFRANTIKNGRVIGIVILLILVGWFYIYKLF